LQRAHLEAALTDPDPTSESWRTACERALAAGTHQERIIDALLTLARCDGGLDRWQPFDLASVTGHALRARRADADHRGIRLTATLDPAPVAGDPRLVERLVTNLIENAVRHNIADGQAEVRTGTQAGQPALSVANTGPDVPVVDVARLFQPFQRLGDGRVGHDTGLGLGLSIVGSIATAHGAHVTAEPRAGGGLNITVRFPAIVEFSRIVAR
jgi:signal transduction histidine kinase